MSEKKTTVEITTKTRNLIRIAATLAGESYDVFLTKLVKQYLKDKGMAMFDEMVKE